MTHEEWSTKYARLRAIADRVIQMRTDRARLVCKQSGLDPSLLGIHPHNAMCSWNSGHPWPGIDYKLVRKCLWLLNTAYEASKVVTKWDRRVRQLLPEGDES